MKRDLPLNFNYILVTSYEVPIGDYRQLSYISLANLVTNLNPTAPSKLTTVNLTVMLRSHVLVFIVITRIPKAPRLYFHRVACPPDRDSSLAALLYVGQYIPSTYFASYRLQGSLRGPHPPINKFLHLRVGQSNLIRLVNFASDIMYCRSIDQNLLNKRHQGHTSSILVFKRIN